MIEFLLAFLGVMILMCAMSIGVILGRAPISGSCGGLASKGSDASCAICGEQRGACIRDLPAGSAADPFSQQARR